METLLTISRLDITAASRAYIIEPHWNPTVEEQALARVHRMGQTKEVTTIRYVMKDTFEEVMLRASLLRKLCLTYTSVSSIFKSARKSLQRFF